MTTDFKLPRIVKKRNHYVKQFFNKTFFPSVTFIYEATGSYHTAAEWSTETVKKTITRVISTAPAVISTEGRNLPTYR
jgi:hypothetical protein